MRKASVAVLLIFLACETCGRRTRPPVGPVRRIPQQNHQELGDAEWSNSGLSLNGLTHPWTSLAALFFVIDLNVAFSLHPAGVDLSRLRPMHALSRPAVVDWHKRSGSEILMDETVAVADAPAGEKLIVESSHAGNMSEAVDSDPGLSGDDLEAMWSKLRGRPLRRSFALWRFFTVASVKTVLANRSDNAARTNRTALWVKNGLLRLGPTMIKLGQVFSSRKDLLHPAYIEALTSLQTAVPSLSGPVVRELLEAELGSPLPFDAFDDSPIAGASLGQVHRAIYDGKRVAVKIQRQKLKELFDTDFRNIRLMCRGLNAAERLMIRIRKWRGKAKSAADRDWMQYADDAARLLYEEIDYRNEGKNAETFAASLAEAKAKRVVVPKVIWNTTTRRVLTMEYVESIKMTDQDAVKQLKLNPEALTQQVVDSFLLQLLQTGVLHCDPHPGNLCATPQGDIVFYDYGMMDTLPPEMVQGMRKMAFSLFGGSTNPSEKELIESGTSLVEGLELAGFLAEGADKAVVEKVGVFLVRFFKDQYAGRATQDVTEQVGAELQSLLDDGYVAFPSAFTFIGRAFTSVDGIARSLQPESYDFSKACEPFVGRLITEEYEKKGDEMREQWFQNIKNYFGIED